MASGRSSGGTDPKTKTILIAAAAVVIILGGILTYLAIKANEDNKVAALRYNFNKYYPDTYDTVEKLDEDADFDGDGISNGEEKKGKTRIVSADTDGDGLADKDEIRNGTDSNSADSDGDGIKDGIEVRAGLSPTDLITDGQTKDADREFTRVIPFDDGNIILKGKANIYGATVDKLTLNSVVSNAGTLTAPYEMYCSDGYDSAVITLYYDKNTVKLSGIDEDSIMIYKFDPYLKKYNPMGGELRKEEGCVTSSLETNGVYVLGADTVIHKAAEAYDSGIMNVHLLIDNSGSMYPKSIQSTSKESDVNFKRLSFAKNFVTALGNEVKFSISVFTHDFSTIIGFDADKSRVLPAISSIRTLGPGFDGTSVEKALMEGLKAFDDDMVSERNIIVLLTDGISTDTAGYDLGDIVSLAKGKNVTINTIGLGDEVDTELLTMIAKSTGGSYYPISEANILEGLYSTIIASMEDDIVDDDFDGTPDSYTLYDTGFDPDFNGFSFQNFKSLNKGTLDFGMVMLARDWFRGGVSSSGGEGDCAYTFTGTTIMPSEPLRKVILQLMQESWTRPENYLNFLSGGNILRANSDDSRRAIEKGWAKITIPYSDGGTEWAEAEILVPNHTSNTIRTVYSENDYQMMRAIQYYEGFRDTGKNFSLNSEADFNRVKGILATGVPIVTKILWQDDEGMCRSRYVLMTTLRRDLENPNIFKIKVYDVNSKFINTIIVTRTIRVAGASENDFTYTASWDNKQVSLACYLTETE